MLAKKLVPVLPVVLGLAAFLGHMHLAAADNYLVREGDTLTDIARRLGVSVQGLAAANGIDDPNFILAGQLLVVPSDGGSATEYVVGEGDTLWTISDKVGVPVSDLARANGLTDPDWVPAGRLLSVPPVGSSSSASPGPAAYSSAGPMGTSRSGTYTVRAGDDLSGIAGRLGVPVGQLAEANGITDPNLIVEGQVIVAPNVWLCPLPSATFVNDYAYVRPDGDVHQGIDLFAVEGTPILAPVSGLVERYPNPSGGLAIRLHGKDGNRYYFAHLDAYGSGGSVTAGDVVGYVGNTGDAVTTSPHLHFEIRPGGGNSVNPFPTLVAACR